MSSHSLKLVLMGAVLALLQLQACNTQFFVPQNPAFTGSLSKASSTATERELQLGRLGLSHGAVNSQSVATNNGGFGNGGTTSIASSRSRSGELNVGRLGIGSTLTASQTRTNDAVSRGLSHDLNVGRLGVETSLSRDNLRNGFGLQRSSDGGLKLGLGLLNVDLSGNRQQQNSQALTQAQAQAQGEDAFATSNSNANTISRQRGLLGFTKTQSQSNALSGTSLGQSSAQAGGAAGVATGHVNYFGLFRLRRSTGNYAEPKLWAQYTPFAFPDRDLNRHRRQFSRRNSKRKQQANANSLANSQNDNFEQQAAVNTQSDQQFHQNGLFQNNGASGIGSNLATDGSSGQLSSANVNQDNSLANEGSQSSNNAQSQALNFDQQQQQAANANAGTKQIENENEQRIQAQGGSQATNSNEYGTSSNIANTNSQAYKEGNRRGSQADSSTQSIFQGANGQNSAAQTNTNASSVEGPDGLISNSASSHASAVSQGGQSANAVASASAGSSSGAGGNNGVSDAVGNAGSFGGAQAASGAIGNLNGAQGFAKGRSGRRAAAFKIRQRKLSSFNTQLRPQQQNQTSSSSSSSALSALEIINESKEINWPKNRIQLYNHYPQQQQRPPQLPQQREQQQPQQIHSQQLHYSSINPNSSTEQFAVIDENERHGRTFTFITDLINSLTQPTCIYPCTLEAYQNNRCCETAVVVPQPPSNVCCRPSWPPSILRPPITIVRPPGVLPPLSPQPLQPTFTYPLIPTQCCSSCSVYGFYGPPPCMRYPLPGGGRPFFMG